MTGLLKVTVTGMTVPAPYVPLVVVEVTFVTVGAVVSTRMRAEVAGVPALPTLSLPLRTHW